MRVSILIALFYLISPDTTSLAQTSDLTVEMIMQDPKTWVGASPGREFFDLQDNAYFFWNPLGVYDSDSLHVINWSRDPSAFKVAPEVRRSPIARFAGWNTRLISNNREAALFAHLGDIYVTANGNVRRLTDTPETERPLRLSNDGRVAYYATGDNVLSVDLNSGLTTQLTDIRSGKKDKDEPADESFLILQQETLFEKISSDKELRDQREVQRERDQEARDLPEVFYTGKKQVSQLAVSPDERYVTFVLSESANNERTEVQNYVTEDGFAETLDARSKVGAKQVNRYLYFQDLTADTTYALDLKQLPGAMDRPFDKSPDRTLRVYGPMWNANGTRAIIEVRSTDNKERWIVHVRPESGELEVLDRQSDEAWIAGPGISWFGGRSTMGWLPDNRHFFFQSEKSGYSHLYVVDVDHKSVTQLTDGDFEVFGPRLSRDGKTWYFTSSEVSPHERHFYSMPVTGGERTRLTHMPGNNSATLSPSEDRIMIRHSYSNQPPELYLTTLEDAIDGDSPTRLTFSTTEKWQEYPWRDPEIVRIRASDGADVPARIYKPQESNGAAVLFVHGAGYLQNVHRWWSSYFREYMFHNLLADRGYTVLDLDFRASAGYGRDWRTAIYRHMGGRDLQDYVDASKYVGETFDIAPERVFIYGGSYGGFITLMALFTEPEHFGGGAALRSVTDWAHYNHGYTSNILNTPEEDPGAFLRSSPIYFAEGLEDPLLIAHGVIDTNVQYQDVIRLAQRLIELGKTDWELASYPVEGHGFTEPSSWTDEYRRILELIEESVGPK